MSVWLGTLHVLNFLAPALGLGLGLALCEMVVRRAAPWSALAIQALALYSLTGAGVLMLGLALGERDGKLATYAALVGVTATLAAWRTRKGR